MPAKPRLASFDRDGWQLRSGEKSHQRSPDTFWVPAAELRGNLRRGQMVKLIFDFEIVDTQDGPEVRGERMWAMVSEEIEGRYLGLLVDEPQVIETGEDIYLCPAAEIAFDAEHVVDIDDASADVVDLMFSEPPTRN